MRTHRPSPAALSRQGVVLIVVLVLVVMISLAGFAFMKRMATEYEATLVGGDLRQAVQTLASAETFLLTVAEEQAGMPTSSSAFLHDPGMFSYRSVNPARLPDGQPDAPPTGNTRARRWRFSVVHRLPDANQVDQLQEQSTETFDRPAIRFGMTDESGKLHLGRVMMWELNEPGSGREALLHIPGMTTEAADSILDWIDEDSDPREFGAEADYYSRLDRPCEPRDGLPESIEELLFVKGVTRQAFYGQTESPQFELLDSAAWPDLLTVSSAEPNTDRFGHDRFDLNDLYPSDFAGGSGSGQSELSFLPASLVKYILLLRLYGAADTLESADSLPPATVPSAASGDSLASFRIPTDDFLDLYDISSLADLVNTSVKLPLAEGGQLFDSPLRSDSAEFPEIMQLLEERTTVDFNDVHLGRININTAPEPVLRSLLNSAELAAQIVRQRDLVEGPERESTAWLLTQRILDLPTYRRIYPHITTRGAVHSGEIIVYREFGGPFLRRRLIIDASTPPARRVAWTDLTERGLPVKTTALRYRGFDSEGFTDDL